MNCNINVEIDHLNKHLNGKKIVFFSFPNISIVKYKKRNLNRLVFSVSKFLPVSFFQFICLNL